MKKIIIIRSSGNELANQLWNYASIYAYSLEMRYTLLNPSFFEYGEYFEMKASPNPLFFILFFWPFRNYTKRKTSIKRRIWRKFYKWYSSTILSFHKRNTVTAGIATFYLPPTKSSSDGLSILEKNNQDIYLDGWLFRNSVGLEKYRAEIREYCRPRKNIQDNVESTIKELGGMYDKIVGVHIRQGDYRTWRNGIYLIEQKR